MDSADLRVRNHVYRRFVERGRTLSAGEAASELGLALEEAEASFRRLHDAHALVLDADSTRIRMLNPFSCVPTAYRVEAGGRWWFANCAWDALGIPAALDVDGHVSTTCADCGEPVELDAHDGLVMPDDVLVHLQVPAARWWDDIVFT